MVQLAGKLVLAVWAFMMLGSCIWAYPTMQRANEATVEPHIKMTCQIAAVVYRTREDVQLPKGTCACLVSRFKTRVARQYRIAEADLFRGYIVAVATDAFSVGIGQSDQPALRLNQPMRGTRFFKEGFTSTVNRYCSRV